MQARRRLTHAYDAWCRGEISFGEFDAKVQGWIAHVQQADTLGLRQAVLQRFALEGRPLERRPAVAPDKNRPPLPRRDKPESSDQDS